MGGEIETSWKIAELAHDERHDFETHGIDFFSF